MVVPLEHLFTVVRTQGCHEPRDVGRRFVFFCSTDDEVKVKDVEYVLQRTPGVTGSLDVFSVYLLNQDSVQLCYL